MTSGTYQWLQSYVVFLSHSYVDSNIFVIIPSIVGLAKLAAVFIEIENNASSNKNVIKNTLMCIFSLLCIELSYTR